MNVMDCISTKISMEYYENRLKTFDTYPKQMLPDKYQLARAGLYYTGKSANAFGVTWNSVPGKGTMTPSKNTINGNPSASTSRWSAHHHLNKRDLHLEPVRLWAVAGQDLACSWEISIQHAFETGEITRAVTSQLNDRDHNGCDCDL